MIPFRIPENADICLMEFFAGVGSQAMAFRDLGANFKTHLTCEWEVNAIASYKAIHAADDDTDYSEELLENGDDAPFQDKLARALFKMGISNDGKSPMSLDTIKRKPLKWLCQTYNNIRATKNLVDITQVTGFDLNMEDMEHNVYVLTYSFPCQDLSVAGKQKGMAKGTGTRSGLLWEVERILTEAQTFTGKLPQVLIMENVPQVHGKNNIDDFNTWLAFLESIGYRSFWKDVNAKDMGVAQSRNRCFCISLLGDYTYDFPSTFELTKTMEDYLEDNAPDSFYVTSDKARDLIDKLVVDGKIPLPEDEEPQNTDDNLMSILLGSPT